MKNNKNHNPLKRKILDIFLITTAAVVIFILVITGVRINSSIAKTSDSPKELLTVQLVNGSSESDAGNKVIDELIEFDNKEFEIKVVEKDRFKIQKVEKSFLIVRSEEIMETAEKLAETIGLDGSQIYFRPLDYNKNYVNLSIVIGDDFQSLIDRMKMNRSEKNES